IHVFFNIFPGFVQVNSVKLLFLFLDTFVLYHYTSEKKIFTLKIHQKMLLVPPIKGGLRFLLLKNRTD
ncbi:MAG: hypothetical protein JZU67_06560, partial [Burkholderiaceae bacterium]|nr:hypothetical protein [Burkholderiaceae bacterium]